jgi:hypothetical protein
MSIEAGPKKGRIVEETKVSGLITKSSFPRHLYVTRLQPD